MKLKEYTPENCVPETAAKAPTISLNTKTGLFNFSKAACELIGLNDGDRVIFFQDQEDHENWYLEKVGKTKGWEVRAKENVTKGVLFNNTTLARELAKSVEFTGISGRMLIAGQPTVYEKRKLWGILTIGLKNS